MFYSVDFNFYGMFVGYSQVSHGLLRAYKEDGLCFGFFLSILDRRSFPSFDNSVHIGPTLQEKYLEIEANYSI